MQLMVSEDMRDQLAIFLSSADIIGHKVTVELCEHSLSIFWLGNLWSMDSLVAV